MDSSTKTSLAVGAAAGYIVGRTKKEKVALGLLSLVTGRTLDPTGLVGRGMRKLADSPRVEHLSESLADALQERTRSLLDGGEEPVGEEPRTPDDEAPEDEAPEDEAPEPSGSEEEEGEPARPSRPHRAGPAKAPRSSAHAAGPKNPPAAKAEAMGRKAKAERASRRPGPKNPPAARAKARGRKSAAGDAARKGSATRGRRST